MIYPEPHVLHLNITETEDVSPKICRETADNITRFRINTFMNGIYNNIVIIRPIDDSYVPFDNGFMETQARLMNLPLSDVGEVKTILLQPNDVSGFFSVLTDYMQQQYNIIIDGRLDKFISIATILLRDDVLIFDSFSLKIMNIYNYTSNFCKISVAEMTLFRVVILHTIKLALSMFRNTNIPIDVIMLYRMITDVETKSYTNPELWVLYNYIRSKHSVFNNDRESVQIERIPTNIVIEQYVSSIIEMNPEALSVDAFALDGISYSHFLSAISQMIQSNVRSVF